MKSPNCAVSTCKSCLHFQTEGRRGGTCGQFDTFAAPHWEVCPLAVSAFEQMSDEGPTFSSVEQPFRLKLLVEHKKKTSTVPSKSTVFPEIA